MSDPRKIFEAAFDKIGAENPLVLAISCDSAKGAGMATFIKHYPDRYVEVGISEQTAIGICAGLAETGFKPVLAAITPFLTMRAYEAIRNDIGYTHRNVTLIGSGGGLAYSTLGSSHEAIEDISLMRTIPNMVILAPGDGNEIEQSLRMAVEHDGPVYLRMPRHELRDIPHVPNEKYGIGKSRTLRKGKDVLILTYGTMINEVLDATDILLTQGIFASVESFLTVRPIDAKALIRRVRDYEHIVTIEEHSKTAGFGGYIAELLADKEFKGRQHILGVEEGSKKVGPYREILKAHGLDSEKIADSITAILKK
ncbi:MAG: transketolase C-terminal domain-containing protein [Erysipelotrichaceae bacterium]